jgi:GNAT superfamily N-acetyltransferase
MPELGFREVTEADLDDVVTLIVRADAQTADWAPEDWALPEGHADRERSVWIKELEAADFRSELALDDAGAIVGVVATKGAGHVSTLFVEPAMQAQGIGGRLLARAEGWLRAGGCERATLNVLDGSPAAGFYDAHGWSPNGERGNFDWFDLPTVGYEKSL